MKKQILLSVLVLLPLLASADTVKIGELWYNINTVGGFAEVKNADPDAYLVDAHVIIPENVTYKEVEYPVTKICDYAFEEENLAAITIPKSVVSIGKNAFKRCRRLQSVYITDLEAWLKIDLDLSNHPFEWNEWGGNLYLNDEIIKNLVIPSGVKSISNSAFFRCRDLTSVSIPNSVTSIGGYAFSSCTSLTSIDIPNSVISIGERAFFCCTGLTSVNIPSSVTSIGSDAFSGCTGLTSVNIPNSVTSIGGNAFSGCTGLTSITIPSSVTSIGGNVFSGCSSLTSITVESGNKYYDSRNGCNAIIDSDNKLISGCKNTVIPNSVTSIGDWAFDGCTGLVSIDIPDKVTSIGICAFQSCTGLTSIDIPNSVISIGERAFYACTGLTSIHIPDNVTSIEWDTFYGCTGLTSIDIPDNVTSIGDQAFTYTGLVYVTLPGSLTSIGVNAFHSHSLTDVYCKAKIVPSASSNSFVNPGNITLYAPSASLNDYKSTEPWNIFKAYREYSSSDIQATEKCSTPTISIANGAVLFSCKTSGVTYHWSISSSERPFTYVPNAIFLPIKLNVYATADGYQNSDVATYEFPTLVGDVDGNGVVNVADHVELSKIIMGQ